MRLLVLARATGSGPSRYSVTPIDVESVEGLNESLVRPETQLFAAGFPGSPKIEILQILCSTICALPMTEEEGRARKALVAQIHNAP